jgi:putative protein-disulfide isomerase
MILCVRGAGDINLFGYRLKKRSLMTNDALLREIAFARSIGGNSFPSLFVQTEKGVGELMINYEDAKATITQIKSVI